MEEYYYGYWLHKRAPRGLDDASMRSWARYALKDPSTLYKRPYGLLEWVEKILKEEGPVAVRCHLRITNRSYRLVRFTIGENHGQVTWCHIRDHLTILQQYKFHELVYMGPRWPRTGLFMGEGVMLQRKFIALYELYPFGRLSRN